MSNFTNISDPLLNNRVETEIFLPSIIIIISSIFGQFGNASIVWATYKNKYLQKRCNILIALNAAVDVVHQCSHYILAYYLFTGINYTTARTCWYEQEASYIAFMVGMIFIVLVGVDRVISVLMPIMYKRVNPVIYMRAIVSIPLIYTIFAIVCSYIEMLEFPDRMIICNIASVNGGPIMQTVGHYLTYIIQTSMLLVYGIMWASIACKKNQSETSKRVMKSLTVIILIILICWPISIIVIPLISSAIPTLFGDNFELQIEYIGVLINLGVSSNYYVYFIFSRDYRIAFKRQLSFLPWCRNAVNVKQQTQAISRVHNSVKTMNQIELKRDNKLRTTTLNVQIIG